MKNTKKKSIYLRYEFSNEKGKPEGGDIFQFSTIREVQEMTGQVLKVAQSDGVAVSFIIGEETPFFGYLKSGGFSKKEAELEMVDPGLAPLAKKAKSPKAKGSKSKKTTKA